MDQMRLWYHAAIQPELKEFHRQYQSYHPLTHMDEWGADFTCQPADVVMSQGVSELLSKNRLALEKG